MSVQKLEKISPSWVFRNSKRSHKFECSETRIDFTKLSVQKLENCWKHKVLSHYHWYQKLQPGSSVFAGILGKNSLDHTLKWYKLKGRNDLHKYELNCDINISQGSEIRKLLFWILDFQIQIKDENAPHQFHKYQMYFHHSEGN